MPTKAKPTVGPDLEEDVAEILHDALDSRYKSAEGYAEDIQEAFRALPRENIEAAAAICRDLGNEAIKNERYDEAVEHYTSVLAAHPRDHEVLANRSLAYHHLRQGEAALNDAALCVNLKPGWAKGYYRLGCALEDCKAYKEACSVFAKVVEIEPDNAQASGRLMRARHMLEMVMNVERVNDPLWMHKPAPPKTELQARAEEAQDKSSAAVSALQEEMGKCAFDFELLRREVSTADKWYAESVMAKGLASHLLAHSAVLAPRLELTALLDRARTDAYAEAVRRHVPRLLPRGQRGVVLALGSAMGLLPLLATEAGANRVYVCEPHGFLAKLAHAQVQRHALLSLERDNWARMPMSLPLAERCRQAGGAAYKCGRHERAIALYTEALQAARSLHGGAEMVGGLLCNRALCYLQLGEADAALADATDAAREAPAMPKAHYRAAQALEALGRLADARAAARRVLQHSRGGKNADAEKLVEQLAGKADRQGAAAAAGGAAAAAAGAAGAASGGGGRGVGRGEAARRAMASRDDRSVRLTPAQVGAALASRCETVRVLHCAFDKLRLHHELDHQAELLLCHSLDHTLLGTGIVPALNALKRGGALAPGCVVLPAAARVWCVGVRVVAEPGVPVHMAATQSLLWSPVARAVDLDEPHWARAVVPVTTARCCLSFDFRADAPPVPRTERREIELPRVAAAAADDGDAAAPVVANAVLFWFDLHLGAGGDGGGGGDGGDGGDGGGGAGGGPPPPPLLSTAPSAALPEGATRIALGQALQFIAPTPLAPVAAGGALRLAASHNRHRLLFEPLDAASGAPSPLGAPRRGLVLSWTLELAHDGHLNRTHAAALRKALFRHGKGKDGRGKPALVLAVGTGLGLQALVAAQARPDVADHVVACEKSADLMGVAQRAAHDNGLTERITFVQKDARNLTAREDLPRKADVLLLQCLDHTCIGEGVLHYLQHLRGSFVAEGATLIPAAAVVKGMVVEMRSGTMHGVDMTMTDAYRWSKEVLPVHLKPGEYTQLSDVFDLFVFDFATAVVQEQVEHMDVAIERDGIVSALVLWYDLILDDEIVVSTSPFVPPERALRYGQGLVYLQPAEVRVRAGATLPLLAAHNGVEMAFTIEEDRMTRKGDECELLPHTRFDPRWEGARVNLDDQWKQIMQSMAHSPKDLAAVQEAVMRFAAQPGPFGLNPTVAERCAMGFLAD